MFLPPILIPACKSSSLAFLIMCSAYRLNKQGDSRQYCRTPFSTLTYISNFEPVSGSNCCFSTYIQVSQEAGKAGLVFPSFEEFSTVCFDPQKGFSIVNKAEVVVFQEFSCSFHDPTDVGNLSSGSPVFSKFSLYIWKFLVYILLGSGLKDFEHYLASM